MTPPEPVLRRPNRAAARSRGVTIAWSVCSLLIGLLYLSAAGALILEAGAWRVRTELHGPFASAGLAFYAPFHPDWLAFTTPADTTDDNTASRLRLFDQGGVELGPPHAQHAAVSQAGAGRFSHWHREIVFSSRSGEQFGPDAKIFAVYPRTVKPVIASPLWLLALGLAIFRLRRSTQAQNAINRWRDAHDRIAARPLVRAGFISLSLVATICLFAWPVIAAWRSGATNYDLIGGHLPWTDALGYFAGGDEVIEAGGLDSFNQKRPLGALFLGVKLFVVGGSLPLAILLQAMLTGACCWLLGLALASSEGWLAATLAVLWQWVFDFFFLPTLFTETLGLAIGAVAAALMWIAVLRHRRDWFAAGVFTLTIALNIRAGAYFVLPFVALSAALLFPRAKLRSVGLSIAAAIAAFTICYAINQVFAVGDGEYQGTLAYVLYGMTKNASWSQYASDFPNFPGSEGELIRQLYAKAYQNFRDDPSQTFSWLYTSIKTYFLYGGIFGHDSDFFKSLIWKKLYNYAVIGYVFTVALFYKSNRPVLLSSMLFGVIISAAFTYGVTGYRTFAATVPLVAAALAFTVSGAVPVVLGRMLPMLKRRRSPSVTPFVARTVLTFSAILLAFLLGGPFLVRRTKPIPLASTGCASDEIAIPVDYRSLSPHIRIVADGSAVNLLYDVLEPAWSADAAYANVEIAPLLREVKAGETLILAPMIFKPDLPRIGVRGAIYMVRIKSSILPDQAGPLTICGLIENRPPSMAVPVDGRRVILPPAALQG